MLFHCHFYIFHNPNGEYAVDDIYVLRSFVALVGRHEGVRPVIKSRFNNSQWFLDSTP